MKALRQQLESPTEWNDLIPSSCRAQTLPWRSSMSQGSSSVRRIIRIKTKMVIAFLTMFLIVLVWSKAVSAGNMGGQHKVLNCFSWNVGISTSEISA